MFEKLKRRSLKSRIDQYLTVRDTSGINSEMKTLGFLVDEALMLDLDAFDSFSNAYNLLPKDVKVFSFLELKKKQPTLQQNRVNNKDFTWKGEIHNQNANEFLEQPFDVLVGYYDGKHAFMDLMMAKSNARFKVGFHGGDERLFDLLIGVDPKNTEAFKAELKKYLIVLKKMS